MRTLTVDGRKVAELRERKGWTQQAAAQKMGISRALVSFIEVGERQPSAQVALQIVRALGVDLDEILVDA